MSACSKAAVSSASAAAGAYGRIRFTFFVSKALTAAVATGPFAASQ
jgi:hypothetical protein